MSQTVRHVVMCSFRPGTSAEQIAGFTAAFRGLQEQIPGIVAFECGENNSPEGMNRAITHLFLLTFESTAARDIYLPHPAHRAFVAAQGGLLDTVQVVDYCP